MPTFVVRSVSRLFCHWFALLVVGAVAAGCFEPDCPPGQQCKTNDGCDGPECGASAAPRACPGAVPNTLVLNEILSNPGGVDTNDDGDIDALSDEYVEVLNLSGDPISTGGVSLVVGDRTRFVFDGRCLGPGESLVVWGGGRSVPVLDGSIGIISTESLRLANDGVPVRLFRDGDTLLDEVQVPAGSPAESWVRAPDGTGTWAAHPGALDGPPRLSPGRCVDHLAFPGCLTRSTTSVALGAPPEPECDRAEYSEVVLNEVLVNPGGGDPSGDGVPDNRRDEFVELMIVGQEPRWLDALQLWVGTNQRAVIHTGCLEPGTVITIFSGHGVVPAADWVGPLFVSESPLALSNEFTRIELWRDFERYDRLDVYAAPDGVSVARFPDGEGDFRPHTQIPGGRRWSPGACTNGGPAAIGCAVR
ncbi:MAG: lamin tail domain-containing protein [Myxococcales bacterium]|nr:lamin tail domain-containing protein [Myxococcales bacterium]